MLNGKIGFPLLAVSQSSFGGLFDEHGYRSSLGACSVSVRVLMLSDKLSDVLWIGRVY